MLIGISERPWFRWALAATFLVVVFLLPSALPQPPQEQAYYQTHNAAQDVVAPVSADERLADYTEALAIFTALLAIVSALQVWLLVRADNASKRVLDLSEKQFLMEGRQADLAEKQHGLARLQHIAANKPQLRIRGIVLGPVDAEGSFFAEGQKIIGSLIIANSGATEARIIDSGYRFFWSADGLPMRPPLDDIDVSPMHLPDDDPIAGFGSRGIQLESNIPLDVRGDYISEGYVHTPRLYLMGFIHYADINQAERYMGFCRIFVAADEDSSDGRFLPVENRDYEYSD
jgi:hypothetical protein